MLRSPRTALPLAAGLLVLLPSAASAHTGAGPAHGLFHGFAHPLLGWDHVLAMLAIGLWAAQHGARSLWALPAAFVGAMAVGGILALGGLHLPGVETGILASVLVLGALIATATRLPLTASIAAVVAFALFHGHAHGTEMPAAVSGIVYGLGFATASALLHAAGIAFVLAARRAPELRRQAWVRSAGAAICFAGVLLWVT